jgi:hypothetical protein
MDETTVGDPDLHVSGPPGSINQIYGSGSFACVERTEIMLAKQNFSKKINF